MKKLTMAGVTRRLQSLIKKYEAQDRISADQMKQWIYEAGGHSVTEAAMRYQQKCLACFPQDMTLKEMNAILQACVDAWNVFPHRSLHGLSPQEMINAPDRDSTHGNRAASSRKSPSRIKPTLQLRKLDADSVRKFLFPKHRKRKKRIREFIDRDHPIADRWYAFVEQVNAGNKDLDNPFDILNEDPEFFEPYTELSKLALADHCEKDAFELAITGYMIAVEKIADRDGEWPEHMEWGQLENRPLLRLLHHTAWLLWLFGQPEAGAMIMRRILRMNPGDNQGIRHELLAIRLGLKAESWEKKFVTRTGPLAGQTLEAVPLTEWFEKHAKKFPEEFGWLFEEWEREGI